MSWPSRCFSSRSCSKQTSSTSCAARLRSSPTSATLTSSGSTATSMTRRACTSSSSLLPRGSSTRSFRDAGPSTRGGLPHTSPPLPVPSSTATPSMSFIGTSNQRTFSSALTEISRLGTLDGRSTPPTAAVRLSAARWTTCRRRWWRGMPTTARSICGALGCSRTSSSMVSRHSRLWSTVRPTAASLKWTFTSPSLPWSALKLRISSASSCRRAQTSASASRMSWNTRGLWQTPSHQSPTEAICKRMASGSFFHRPGLARGAVWWGQHASPSPACCRGLREGEGLQTAYTFSINA
mmetsp:Transcript_19504/g.54260  ORF Transcript_19504/g.54260 Transcript_19504/m.54260 type:complete len:295 (-) Transcript_19504:121-1005(-)